MSLQSVGRAQFAKMRRLAQGGTKQVTFRLFDDIAYDPETGASIEPLTEHTITVFATRGSTQETKVGSIIATEFQLVFEQGLLPRVPLTQDEAIIDGALFKVVSSDINAMGVHMTVTVRAA